MYPTMTKKTLNLNFKTKAVQYLLVFFGALILAHIIFIPFVIMDGGTFNYIGDYNCQQIPFYIEANESVRNGELFWNWNTDLGANFIGSYAFYLIGSPFFWLTVLLPLSWVPKAIPFLICLKTAVAALTAYAYLKRVVKNKNYAFLGALLYAFSGFSFFNIFFNHFHDIIAFFPLLLIGLEKLLGEGKKGWMAAAVFINALTNYYFFVAEVVFVVIYFFIGLFTNRWEHITLKKFFALCFESIIGFIGAAFIVLPAVLTTLQIDRASSKLSGWAWLTYYETQRPMQILQAFFLPPEICSITNMLPDAGARWSSVNAWLPMFGFAGAMTWMSQRKKRDFFSYMVLTLMIMAFVPALNAVFQLFSNNFYTRWFFTLTLMLSAVTIKAIEECTFKEWCWGTLKASAVALGMAVPIALIKNPDSGERGLAIENSLLWAYIGIAVIGIIATLIALYLIKSEKRHGIRAVTAILMVFILLFGWFYLGISKNHGSIDDDQSYTDVNVYGRWNMETVLNDGERIDTVNTETNAGMFWNMPTMRAFHSVVPGSIFDFYHCMGEERDVKSDVNFKNYALKSLLSVKYVMEGAPTEDSDYTYLNFEYIDNEVDVYSYEHYIPMGFSYDAYITRSELEKAFSENLRDDIMLTVLVVEDAQEELVADILTHADTKSLFSKINLVENVASRKENTCSEFTVNNKGFNANYSAKEEETVFFSVPYEEGWSVKINGEEADIIRANVGFMAVTVPKGDNTISFEYMTPGLIIGLIIAITAVLAFIIYMIFGKIISVKKVVSPKIAVNEGSEIL